MPNLDGTGPNGKGPKSGRGVGNCADQDPKKVSKVSRFLRLGRDMGYRPFRRRRK